MLQVYDDTLTPKALNTSVAANAVLTDACNRMQDVIQLRRTLEGSIKLGTAPFNG